jgi:glucose-1-phosphate cytidylyltransferase
MKDIPVVILCGGRGSRLGEESDIRPKPMVEIGGKPILWHIMKIYSSYGYNRFILALGYKADYIKTYFQNYRNSAYDFTLHMRQDKEIIYHSSAPEKEWEITFIDTGLETLKGARIKMLEKYINSDNFFLTYGDGVSNIDIEKLYNFHIENNKIATLSAVRPPSRFGIIEIKNNIVEKFDEKPQMSEGFINGGFFVLNRKIFDFLTEEINCDFEFGPLDKIARIGQLMAYKHNEFWQCMDTKREKDYLENLWSQNKALWKTWD